MIQFLNILLAIQYQLLILRFDFNHHGNHYVLEPMMTWTVHFQSYHIIQHITFSINKQSWSNHHNKNSKKPKAFKAVQN